MQRFKLFVALVAACWLGLVLTFAWPAIAGSFGGGAGARNATVTGTVTATQGTAAAITAPWPAQLSDGTNALGTSGNPIRTDTTASTTQPVSGTVTVTQGTAAAIGAPWPTILSDGAAAVGTAGNPIRTDTTASTTQPVSGTVTVGSITAGDTNIGNVDIASIAAGDTNIGNVDIVTVPAPLNVVGTGLEATALRVTIATDSTGLVSVDDGAGSLTVDGTVAVSSVPAPLSTTGTGLEATALRVTIATDSTGVLSVDDNAGSLTVDGTVTVGAITAGDTNIGNIDVLTVPAPLNVVGTGLEATALRVTLATDSTGVLSVDDNAGSLTVDGTVTVTDGAGDLTVDGTVTVGSITAGDNNIGNVDIVTVPAPLSTSGGGTEATALRVTLASDSTGLVSVDDGGGAITIDGSVSIVGSTGATGGAPLASGATTTASNCAANGTTTFTPTAGTYEVCALTSGSDVLVYLCYEDDGGSGTDCLTLGEPYNASATSAGCKVRRLANVAHYCRGDATADLVLVPLTY